MEKENLKRLKKSKKLIKKIGDDKEEAKKIIKILIASYDINSREFVQKIG